MSKTAASAPHAPPFPPVQNIPPVIETAPGEPLPPPPPVTVAMTEKYGPKGPNRLTPEQLWALAPEERARVEALMAAEDAAAPAAAAPPAPAPVPAQPAAAAPHTELKSAPPRRPRPPRAVEKAPDAPPFPPVENIPPVIETAPGEPLPAPTPVTVAMTEKYGPKAPNRLTPEELWALAGGRKQAEEEGEGAGADGAAAAVADAAAEAAGALATSAADTVAAAASKAVKAPRVIAPAPDAPPFPPVENIPPVIETAPGALLPSNREMTVAMTEKYGPKGPNHRTPAELWELANAAAAKAAENAAAASADTAATGAPAAAPATPTPTTTTARVAVRPPYVPEAPHLGYQKPVIETAKGQPLPSQREMTLALTEHYGPKSSNRMTPAELEKRGGYRSVMPPERESPFAGTPAEPAAAAAKREAALPEAASAAPTAVAATPAAVNAAPATPAAVPTAVTTTPNAAATGHAPGTAAATTAPAAVATAAANTPPVKVAPAKGAPVKAPPVKVAAAKAAPVTSAEAEPSTVRTLMGNRLFMSAFAVGAAALTVFSVYKGVELYNRYMLNQCISEQAREVEVVHLYIHRRSPLAPSVSIPCTRVETFLRLAKIPYEAHVISDPEVSPDGKLPFLVYAKQRVAGPQNIIEFLSVTFNVHIDREIGADGWATGVAVLSALEYSLVRGYMRSVHVEKPDLIRPYYSEMNRTPDFITRMALRRLRHEIERTNDTSGYNKLTSEQFQYELAKDAKAIETLLGDKDFLFTRDYPTSFDCALYAWLLPIVAMEDAADVNMVFEYIVQSVALTNFVKRMTDIAFPDLDELVSAAVAGEIEASSSTAATTPGAHAKVAAAAANGSGSKRPQSLLERRQSTSRRLSVSQGSTAAAHQ